MVPARHRSGCEKGRPGEKAAPLSIVRVPHPGQPYRYSIPTGAVLIRPTKNLIGAESVQERPTDARGAGRPPGLLPGLAQRPSSARRRAPDRTLTQGDPTTRGGRGRSLVPRELDTRYLGRRGICAVDLLRKSGEFLMSYEELDDTAATVYEGI